jgi:hypothetical protein
VVPDSTDEEDSMSDIAATDEAALGLAGLLVGATVTNLLVLGERAWLPIGLLLVSALVARGRWSRTKALAARVQR